MALDGEKITLCWPNYVNESSLSGGSWTPQMPVDFLKSQLFSRRAVSSTADPADTQISVQFSRFRPVYALAIAAHNLTTSAQWRVRGYYSSDLTDQQFDTGWTAVWPAVYSTAELEWEFDNFWTGSLAEEDRNNFTPLSYVFLDNPYICQSLHIEISDPNNPAGYVAIGRLLISDAWQPEINMAYGVTYGYENGTTIDEANDPNRTEHFDPATPKRTMNFTLDSLSEDEAFNRIHRMQRVQGVHNEVLVAEGVDYRPEKLNRVFIGRITEPDPLSHPYHQTYSTSISLKEIL